MQLDCRNSCPIPNVECLYQADSDQLGPRLVSAILCSSLHPAAPATAGSRASGEVISAWSSTVSSGDGVRSLGRAATNRSTAARAIVTVGGHLLDHLRYLDEGGFVAPAIIIGDHADQRVG